MAFRNRYILEHSEKVVFAAIDPNGALSRLIGEYPDLQWQVLASVGSAGGFIWLFVHDCGWISAA